VALMKQVVNCALYRNGQRVRDLDFDRLGDVPDAPGQLIWIGLFEPDEHTLSVVQRRFGLHELAIEDANTAHQRPKLEVYGETLFVVLRTARREGGYVVLGETHIFLGRGHVITVRHGPSQSFAAVRARCESAPKALAKGEDFILYALMDFVVDNYFPILDEIEDEIEKIEDEIFTEHFVPKDIERVYEVRRELIALRHAVFPLLEICTRLTRYDIPLVDRDTYPYFRDVQDHTIKANDTIDQLRETLSSALEAHLLLSSVRQNEVTKKLAGWAAILAVPTAIAGIYGMNFDYMPELRWTFGYPLAIGVIGVACGYLFYRFRKSGWL
jgi:magnesium transporter